MIHAGHEAAGGLDVRAFGRAVRSQAARARAGSTQRMVHNVSCSAQLPRGRNRPFRNPGLVPIYAACTRPQRPLSSIEPEIFAVMSCAL